MRLLVSTVHIHTECLATRTNERCTNRGGALHGMLNRKGTPAHGQAVCFPGNGDPDDGDREVQVPHLRKKADTTRQHDMATVV